MDPAPKPAGPPAPPTVPDALVDLTGRTLGDFRVVRRLGQGGMGQVYLAEQVSLKRKVALKLLKADLAGNPQMMERFKVEATAVAGLNHANIVQIYVVGEADGLHYMALEYVDGRTLREFVEKKGPPDLPLALSIMRQGAAALARAGELGLVHRDIKPDNILLTRKGEVKVADFGLAKALGGDVQPLHLTQSGVVMGTPLYMSPEQVAGKPLDCRSDIYSFGVTCYHMLTGGPPFCGRTPLDVALQHLQAEPPPLREARPDLPEALCAVVHKMMAKDPAQRYQTARDLLREIARLRDGLAGSGTAQLAPLSVGLVPSVAPAAAPPTAPVPRWRRAAPVAGVAAVVLAAGVGAALAHARRGADRPPPHAAGAEPTHDVKQVEALLSGKEKREQVLRDAVEQYLDPPGGFKDVNTTVGLGLCLDLLLFYLDEHRVEEAARFCARLEASRQVPAYQNLGRLGRAIVLALQSRERESNELFREFFRTAKLPPPLLLPGRRWEARKKGEADPTVMLHPRLRFWIAEALRYNAVNGIPDADVPPTLAELRKLTAR